MKVRSIQGNPVINEYKKQRQTLKQGEMNKQSKDKVTISEDAKYLSKLNGDNENLDMDKVNEIKNRIKQGTYTVNSKSVARRIIEVEKGE